MKETESDRFCRDCPRACLQVRDHERSGSCHASRSIRIARISLHPWEEPIISGQGGSATIFFSGCNLHCVFCQNYKISQRESGRIISENDLLERMFALQEVGAENINLVTPSPYIRELIPVLKAAKAAGLAIPICWNSSGYDALHMLKELAGLVDIYLVDFKYYSDYYAEKYSAAPHYRATALAAVDEMLRQQPLPILKGGMMQKGVVIRHLLLPGLYFDSRKLLRLLRERYGDAIYLSLMNQYTPMYKAKDFPEINRELKSCEYEGLLSFACELGFSQGFSQDDKDKKNYTPPFGSEQDILHTIYREI